MDIAQIHDLAASMGHHPTAGGARVVIRLLGRSPSGLVVAAAAHALALARAGGDARRGDVDALASAAVDGDGAMHGLDFEDSDAWGAVMRDVEQLTATALENPSLRAADQAMARSREYGEIAQRTGYGEFAKVADQLLAIADTVARNPHADRTELTAGV